MITETDWHYDLSGCSEHDKPTLAENEIIVQVPFYGTYNALDEYVNMAMEQEEEYYNHETEEDGVLHGTFFMADYLKDYVAWIADFCGLKSLKFREMTSPREYNFSTDKLWCSVDKNELWKLYNERLDSEAYDIVVQDVTTYRDGYIPNYRADDFYHDSLDDMAESPACVLGLIVDNLCHVELCETCAHYKEDSLNVWELFDEFNSWKPVDEYMDYSVIEAE